MKNVSKKKKEKGISPAVSPHLWGSAQEFPLGILNVDLCKFNLLPPFEDTELEQKILMMNVLEE